MAGSASFLALGAAGLAAGLAVLSTGLVDGFAAGLEAFLGDDFSGFIGALQSPNADLLRPF